MKNYKNDVSLFSTICSFYQNYAFSKFPNDFTAFPDKLISILSEIHARHV